MSLVCVINRRNKLIIIISPKNLEYKEYFFHIIIVLSHIQTGPYSMTKV